MTVTIPILYEDDAVLVVDKPVGVLSEDAPTDTSSVPTLLAHHAKNGFPLVPVTRLDRNVGGVMLLAKTKKSAAFLSAEVTDHQKCIKEYRAVVRGVMEEEMGELRDLLFKDSAKNKSFAVKRMRRGVKEAVLTYAVEALAQAENETVSLVAVRLFTGRTHQIRVQFSSRKHPLLGDGKYGGDSSYPLALHAYRLSFEHPCGKRLTFTSPCPDSLPWSLFGDSSGALSCDNVAQTP